MVSGHDPRALNPYIAGNPVTGREMFFGREDVFAYVREHLTGKYRDNAIVLYGQRRTGKTSVLYQMSRHLDTRYLCVFVDLHGLALQGISGFLWELANHITRVLRREYQISADALPRLDAGTFAADPRSQFENDFLPGIWAVVGDRHLLLMLDEAIRLEEQVRTGKMEREVFQYLRHLMQHFERLNFLFSLGSGLEEMAQEYAFLFSVALYKKISFLDRDAAFSLITQPAKECYEIDAAAVERILELTCGHAYFTQLVCHSLFAFWQSEGMQRIAPAHVDAVLNEVLERGSAVLKHVWEESGPGEKAVMTGIATATGDHDRPIGTAEIERVWTSHDLRVPVGETVRALQRLLARDVITGSDAYTFAVEIQRLWVRRHRRPEWVREEIADALAEWSREPDAALPDDEGEKKGAEVTGSHHTGPAGDRSDGAQAVSSRSRVVPTGGDRRPILERKVGRRAFVGAVAGIALIGATGGLVARHLMTGSPALPSINSVAFSPDGKLIASGGDDYTIRFWDAATGHRVGSPLTGHTDPVITLAFRPDGKLVASGSSDYTVRLWDVTSAKADGAALSGPTNTVYSVAFSPDGSLLASGTGSTIWLWDVKTRKPIGSPLVGHTDFVYSVAFSPDGQLLASGSNDRTIRLWEVTTRRAVGTPLQGHAGYVTAVDFSPDGKFLASSGEDDTVRFWDVETGRPANPPLTSPCTLFSARFSPHGDLIAAGGSDNTVKLWDSKSRKPVGSPLTGHSNTVYSVTFSPDGKLLASGSYDGTIRLWDVAKRKPFGEPIVGSA